MERPGPISQPLEKLVMGPPVENPRRGRRRSGPSETIPVPVRALLVTPQIVLAGEVAEVSTIDAGAHEFEASSPHNRTPKRAFSSYFAEIFPKTTTKAKEMKKSLLPVVTKGLKGGKFMMDELFWRVGTYPWRGRFWPKVNKFHDHPEEESQKNALKWVLGHTTQEQLPQRDKPRHPIRDAAMRVLDTNRLSWQAPLWGVSLVVPIGPILSLPINATNTFVAFRHGEIKKGVGYVALSALDIGPFALGVAAIPIFHLPLIGLSIVAGINIASTFLPTNTMLVEPYHSAYTDAYVNNILALVVHELDPIKREAHKRTIDEFLTEKARKAGIVEGDMSGEQEYSRTLLANIQRDLAEIGDATSGKISQQRVALRTISLQREHIKQAQYEGRIPWVGDLMHLIGKQLQDVKPHVQKILAERLLSKMEEEKSTLHQLLTIFATVDRVG